MRLLLCLLLVGACGDEAAAPGSGAAALESVPESAVLPLAPPAATGPSRADADAAFNAAMMAYETGDPAAEIRVPQAVLAYQALGELDSDGMFHLALLQLAGGEAQAARATAEQVLAEQPTHLLALGVAARAATAAGDAEGARALHARFLDAYEGEQGRLPEYAHHTGVLPLYLEAAQGAVGG